MNLHNPEYLLVFAAQFQPFASSSFSPGTSLFLKNKKSRFSAGFLMLILFLIGWSTKAIPLYY